MSKTYKLQKWYPSLPKDWEVGMEVGQGDRNAMMANFSPCSSKYSDVQLPYKEIVSNPEFWEEIKKPLFITDDKIEIFEGDLFYFITSSGWDIGELVANANATAIYARARFSTRELAKKYIGENKPRFSLKDINDALGNTCGIFLDSTYVLDLKLFKHNLGI